MKIAENVDNVSIPVDVAFVIEKGQQISINNKLKKATYKFLSVAIFFAILIGFVCTKVSIPAIIVSQIGILVILLLLDLILTDRKVRREV